MIKFSVLLPTRNRLEYLRYAVSSVLNQNYENWEIIISDNCSEEDIKGYVDSLKDPRIKYICTKAFVPVTENWNHALEQSQGDYIIMLGDDDCLMKNYFVRMVELIQHYHSPDFIYNSALNYVYPHVLPNYPKGLLHIWGNAGFLEGKDAPFILDKNEAEQIAKETMNFKVVCNFNAQFSLIKKSLINSLKKYGPFYQSPYPDYYSTTALFLKAERILAVPEPLVVVGTTPKSFGYYYFNQQEKQGIKFLKNNLNEEVYHFVQDYLLPGSDMNSSWLIAMEMVRKNFEKEFQLTVSYNRYRFLQILDHYKRFITNSGIGTKDLWELSKSLSWSERIFYLLPIYFIALTMRLRKEEVRKSLAWDFTMSFSHPKFTMTRILGDFENILEVFENAKLPIREQPK